MSCSFGQSAHSIASGCMVMQNYKSLRHTFSKYVFTILGQYVSIRDMRFPRQCCQQNVINTFLTIAHAVLCNDFAISCNSLPQLCCWWGNVLCVPCNAMTIWGTFSPGLGSNDILNVFLNYVSHFATLPKTGCMDACVPDNST